jgi:uncharacterized protein (DUF1499 family)
VNGRKAAKARARRLSLPGLGLALVTALAAALAGLGHRWGLWDFGTGFTILRWAAYLGAAAAAMSACVWVYALLSRSASGLLLTGLAIALGVASAAVPWSYLRAARDRPPIHDISTDTEVPPRFVALLAARDRAGARSDYGGQSVATQQLRAYPKLGSVTLTLAPDQAFERALSAARDLGWSIVAAVPDEGRIEASDRSFWFGFTDDVVIRIRGHENGSLIDIRSVSRVGIGDLGVNAARIQAFTEKLVDGPEGR